MDYIPINDYIKTLNQISDYHDPSTKDHSRRTREIVTLLGERLGFTDDSLRDLKYAADIHDVGKVAIEAHILRQASQLSASQRVSVNKHCEFGVEIIKYANFNQSIINAVLYHHEHWDGSGYPFSLRGENIPLVARIVCLADVWDAINDDRPYRTAMSEEEAMLFMSKYARWFDPKVFAIWLGLRKEHLI